MGDLSSPPNSPTLLNPKPENMVEDFTQLIEEEDDDEEEVSGNSNLDMEVSNQSQEKVASRVSQKSSKKLTNERRQLIFETLLKESKDGKLKQGTITAAASYFSISRRTVLRIWKQAKECWARGVPVDVSTKFRGRVGRKRIEIDFSKLQDIPDGDRPMNIRSLAKVLNASKSLIHRRLKEGAIAPYLKAPESRSADDKQVVRVKLCLSVVDQGIFSQSPVFINVYSFIHSGEMQKPSYIVENNLGIVCFPVKLNPKPNFVGIISWYLPN